MLTNDNTGDDASGGRRRRAAAVAAQKNWQILSKPEEENIDDDIIIVNYKSNKNTSITTTPTAGPSRAVNVQKKTVFQRPIVIDMLDNNSNKRKSTTIDLSDSDYNPREDLLNSNKKKITNLPVRRVANTVGTVKPVVVSPYTNTYTVVNPMNTRTRTQQKSSQSLPKRDPNLVQILYEDSNISRFFMRNNSVVIRKAPVTRMHPNEPNCFPVVDDKVEEIVGTYNDEEEYDFIKNDIQTDSLEIDVFNGTDDQMDEEIEIIEEKGEPVKQTPVETNRTITAINTRKGVQNKSNIANCRFDEVIGTLAMDCENFDDEYTDNIRIDCEEDILNDKQWYECVNTKKEYSDYFKAVKSTKSVSFLPEDQVTDPVGSVTKVISETTRTLTTPIITRSVTRPRAREMPTVSAQLNQSISSVTPNNINMFNNIPQRMATPPRPQNITVNGSVINPVSSAPPISTPLILCPPNSFTPNMSSIPPGVQVILSQTTPGQAFIVYPNSSSNSMTTTGIPLVTNSFIPNQNLRQTLTTTAFNNNMIYSQTRFRAQTSIAQQHQQLQHQLQQPLQHQQLQHRLQQPLQHQQLQHQLQQPLRHQLQQPLQLQHQLQQPLQQHLRIVRAPMPYVRPNTPMGRPRLPTVAYGGNVTRPQRNTAVRQTFIGNNNITITATNELYDCLTAVKGNQTKKVSMKVLLTIKPLPFTWPSNIDDLINSLIRLDNALMKEKFKESPIAWMVNAQLIKPPNCSVCTKGFCNQVAKSKDAKNEYWMCNNNRCSRKFVIKRPSIFSETKFDIPVSKLLFIIYYWSIQVDVEDLIKTGQIEMGTEIIFNIWQKLQKVCSQSLVSKDSMLGSTFKGVDIASVQIGRFHVIGAMESGSHRCKLAVISISSLVQQNGKELLLGPIVRWVEKGTQLRTSENKFAALRSLGYRVTVVPKNEFLSGNVPTTNIGSYLNHHLNRLFKDIDVSCLTQDIINNILDELLWRERYGSNPFSAFYNIIKHIAEQCGLRKPDQRENAYKIQIPIEEQIVSSNLKANNSSFVTHRQVGRPRSVTNNINIQNQQTVDLNTIFVDEYFYASLELKSSFAKNNSSEETSKDSIQCHLCQMFFDNILIVKHLMEHLEQERKGRVRKGDNDEMECKHCLRFFSNRSMHMHEELSNSKLVPFSCRICLQPFFARNSFIHHMKTSHFSGEMPYYCDICSYRSSFQKNLLDHFEATHLAVGSVMCPYCVRMFNISKFKNLSQFMYRHLTTHYAVASVYDCDKCVLTFTTKADLKEHCFKGHNFSNAIDEKFDLVTYVIPEEEKTLCVKASEHELFTPNLPSFGGNEYNSNQDKQNSNNNEAECSLEVGSEGFDFTIEPEIQMTELNETNTAFTNFILPVDSDYTNEQFIEILTKSFELSEDQKNILYSDKTVNCFECKSTVSVDHFVNKTGCSECNFVTHCKQSFDQHMTDVHSTKPIDNNIDVKSSTYSSSVFSSYSSLNTYNIVCQICQFTTNDGNKIANHMIAETHLDINCKSIKQNSLHIPDADHALHPDPDISDNNNPEPDDANLEDNPQPDNPQTDNPQTDNPQTDNPQTDNPQPDNPQPDIPDQDNPHIPDPDNERQNPDNAENPYPDNANDPELYPIEIPDI